MVTGADGTRLRAFCLNAALFVGAVSLGGVMLEGACRVFTPFPYFSPREIDSTPWSSLLTYDSLIGWRGVPNARGSFTTQNSRVTLEHNSDGFRDVEHSDSSQAPAIVLLGDSFTWGHEVGANAMFGSLLRASVSGGEFFNLSHRGYGTDQELLTLQQWHPTKRLHTVILLFTENDVSDNNAVLKYGRSKPRFVIDADTLVLTNVPVPLPDRSADTGRARPPMTLREAMRDVLLRSHIVHLAYFEYTLRQSPTPVSIPAPAEDLSVTRLLLARLNRDVRARGGRLIVFFAPSKREIEKVSGYVPYQRAIQAICRNAGIDAVDLAPALAATRQRTYFRAGAHWNERGHQVVAAAMTPYVSATLSLRPDSIPRSQ
jgi:lysophospholipase L1-like esterase